MHFRFWYCVVFWKVSVHVPSELKSEGALNRVFCTGLILCLLHSVGRRRRSAGGVKRRKENVCRRRKRNAGKKKRRGSGGRKKRGGGWRKRGFGWSSRSKLAVRPCLRERNGRSHCCGLTVGQCVPRIILTWAAGSWTNVSY